jgi:5-methylcytosine-specific restriction endonuclease McrA
MTADIMLAEQAAIVTRKQAKASGLKYYFTGKPCKHGHIAKRNTIDGGCYDCCLKQSRAWKARNQERVIKYATDWAKANPEKVKERDRRRYAKNPKAWQAKVARWVLANKEQFLAARRAWCSRNKPKLRAVQRKIYWKNPAKYAAKSHIRRANGRFTSLDIMRIRRLQKDRCAMPFCRKNLCGKGQIDHIKAVASGGSNEPKNLQLLCTACNARKSAKDQIDFLQGFGLLL